MNQPTNLPINDSCIFRREHILQEVEKEKMTQGEEKEVEEDFGDGYFAQYQKGIYFPPPHFLQLSLKGL